MEQTAGLLKHFFSHSPPVFKPFITHVTNVDRTQIALRRPLVAAISLTSEILPFSKWASRAALLINGRVGGEGKRENFAKPTNKLGVPQ